MTCLEIEIKLMQELNIRTNLIVCNVTPLSGLVRFETDLLSLSKSGYTTGVEIKTSKSDLKNDLKKRQWKNLEKVHAGKSGLERYFEPYKHFYYAVPEDLVEETKIQVPSWCGIYSVGKRVKEVRKAKQILPYDKTRKWSKDDRLSLARLGAMRVLNMKKKELKYKSRK